ncbi:MAG: BatA domain-containing protein, partial [Rhodobacteraceae bacterium]|nr:BatA domain-containing protein [Paracoccaceae bacterium]
MSVFGSIGFLSPWLLLGLLGLPLLLWLLRVAPPAPLRLAFPAVTLLLGLKDRENTPERTPWWLLVLRMLAIAAAIIAFAQPILNPTDRVAGKGPLLIAMDASWASAQNWDLRQDKLEEVLRLAEQDARTVALIKLSTPPKADTRLGFDSAATWTAKLESLKPNAWEPHYEAWTRALAATNTGFETVWFSDGLRREGRDELGDVFTNAGDVHVVQPDTTLLALRPVRIENGQLLSVAIRSQNGQESPIVATAIGPDPAGITRVLAKTDVVFAVGQDR